MSICFESNLFLLVTRWLGNCKKIVCKYDKNIDAHHQMQVTAAPFYVFEMKPTNIVMRECKFDLKSTIKLFHQSFWLLQLWNQRWIQTLAKWFSVRVDLLNFVCVETILFFIYWCVLWFTVLVSSKRCKRRLSVRDHQFTKQHKKQAWLPCAVVLHEAIYCLAYFVKYNALQRFALTVLLNVFEIEKSICCSRFNFRAHITQVLVECRDATLLTECGLSNVREKGKHNAM